ncbi:MAG: sulfatase [Deltaproteobacteria bacterium]|nr:sulfatase [Deltaproteobacteria bacterium]
MNFRSPIVALGAACLFASGCRHEEPRPKADNVTPKAVKLPAGDTAPLGLIVITVDTLRADYLSSYGHARILTPSFDRLASGGILFKQAISQASTTTPSHASIMTSLYLQDHNVYTNFEAVGDAARTLAEVMAGRGFNTFGIVNMNHLNPEVSNLGQGFETFVKSGNMRRAGPTVDKTLEWLDKNGEQPFFAWIHFTDVHTPYNPPPPYDRFYYDDDERDPAKRSLAKIWHLLPSHMTDHPFFQRWLEGITDSEWVMAQYQGAVTYVDDEFGRLLDRLEQMGLLERTAIVLTADHGESLGEHDIYYTHTGLYEPTIHVPLITYFPGAGRQGVQVRDVVESVDIMPTVLEYFDIPVPKGAHGRSLWPLIRGEVQPERVALSEHAGRNLVVLRTDRYKYIKQLRTVHLQPSYPWVEGREELYDLKADPLERRDLARDQNEVMRVFRKELDRRRGDRLNLQVGAAELTDETVEVLRAMGYVR